MHACIDVCQMVLSRLPCLVIMLTHQHDMELCAAGDTVNVASRMESSVFQMAVQDSQSVVDEVDTPENFHALGERNIKGKGTMTTYLMKVVNCIVVPGLSPFALLCKMLQAKDKFPSDS